MERPVLSSRVNMIKSFAFCEFATVEICDGVFNRLNNAQMGTGNLRFGRPKAYEQLAAECSGCATIGPSCTKLGL